MTRCAACLVAILAASCTGWEVTPHGEPPVVPEGCNPLAYEHDCMLPFPSDVFLQADADTPSGRRVVISDAAVTRDTEGRAVDMLALHPADGFSPGSQLLALFPQGIDEGPLIGALDDPLRSLDDDSPTLLLDADSGERIMHLAETDPRALDDARRALVIRPLVRLTEGRRYVVAIRTLLDHAGAPIPAPRGFAYLRDGGTALPIAERYEREVFGVLTEAGIARGELTLAWDFTVRSRQDAIGDMLRVRELTLEHLMGPPPALTVVAVEDAPDAFTARRIELSVQVPLFVDSGEPGALLTRDALGRVTASGTVDVPFAVWIPRSVAERPIGSPPARLMQFGHGFFGSRAEVDSFIVELADERQLVVVAADWWGMSDADRIAVADQLNTDLSLGLGFTDRLHQAMANYMVVADAAQRALGALAEVDALRVDAAPLFAPSPLYFYGISLGGILGGSYLALSPSVERGVLSVGAANFSLMLFRARPFVAFLVFIAIKQPDFLDHQKFGTLAQFTFDRVDPLSYAPLVMDEVPAGSPTSRRVLMQIGVGDSAVPNLASHVHARALGMNHLSPAPRPIAGLPTSPGPVDRAIVEFDFGIDPLPGAQALPPSVDNEAHEGVRRSESAKEQLHRFFMPGGLVEHTCDGVCDPE